MKMNSNTLFIILSACIVAAGAFWYLYMNNAPESPLTTSAIDTHQKMEFQRLANELPLTFDSRIFSDPLFLALRDLTIEIAKEPIGRTDPFAPVAGIRAGQ